MAQKFDTRQSQGQKQKQEAQQKLSPQQIQFVKLLQLPLTGLEHRIKEELELNPLLEEFDAGIDDSATDHSDNDDYDPGDSDDRDLEDSDSGDLDTAESEPGDSDFDADESEPGDSDLDGGSADTDTSDEIDWEEYAKNTEYEGTGNGYSEQQLEEWSDIPDPYRQTLLEKLEQQVQLLDLNDAEQLIADQILGSLDDDGYFRRESVAIADNIAFNHGLNVTEQDVERVRKKIQKLEPAGIASKDLRDCLLSQLLQDEHPSETQQLAIEMLTAHWPTFEKKHFEIIQKRMDLTDDQVRDVIEWIRTLDPRPGASGETGETEASYIEPEFEVIWNPDAAERKPAGKDQAPDNAGIPHAGQEFIIKMNHRNLPDLRISPSYKKMWDSVRDDTGTNREKSETRSFIKEKMESAKWFIESIQQRQKTLRRTMTAIVELQKDFFRYGEPIRPMILKDVAEKIGMDISTVSRVVNGKYVQTSFGVRELKYFFSEALETENGEDVSTREVKKVLRRMIEEEDKSAPLSDQKLTDELSDKGYKVARRTVAKYREQMQYPVARLRKEF